MRYVNFSWCESIRKIPDLSMIPNIKVLKFCYCKNLVEIDDSLGRLDKLEVLDLTFCGKLETLPSCLSMKSLRSFNLNFCASLKKFPNISQEMKSLEKLYLQETGISELPLSFGNLTGIIELELGDLAVHLHLPGSIYNLQRLEYLNLTGHFIFPKDEEIYRHFPVGIYGRFSRYLFPSLKGLSLHDFSNHSEMDFILNYCCPPSLESLWIYDSEIVTLPECISRFKGLETLEMKHCFDLQEIPNLPRSIRYVSAPTSDILVQVSLL